MGFNLITLYQMNTQFLDDFTTDELIVLFEAVRDKLNLKSITSFAKDNKCAYNTAKTKVPFTSVDGTKYLPDHG